MADKRKSKQKRNADGDLIASKEDYAVAKYLRFTLEPKKGKLVGIEVDYFIGSKAVEVLLESKWAASKAKNEADILFTNRSSCIEYCHSLLEKKLFHIANKVERKKDRVEKIKKKKKDDDIKADEQDTGKKSSAESTPVVEKKLRDRKKGKKDQSTEGTDKEGKNKDSKSDTKKDEEKDKKKKEKLVKLEMANRQMFTGGEQYCVWIYDPVPVKTFVIGLFLVVGAIALCLFPLWPPEVRIAIYYLSLVGLALVGVLIVLIIVRYIIFCVLWCCTLGKHHLWIFPNLTEDVGFFDSFKPFYTHVVHEKKATSATLPMEQITIPDKDLPVAADTDKRAKSKGKKKAEEKTKDIHPTADRPESSSGTKGIEKDDSSGSAGDQDFEVVQYSEAADEYSGENEGVLRDRRSAADDGGDDNDDASCFG